MQVEGRLAAEASGVENQEQLEVQSLSDGDSGAAAQHHPLPEGAKGQDSRPMPSTLQYIAQQADASHAFQQEVKSQRQDKTEL